VNEELIALVVSAIVGTLGKWLRDWVKARITPQQLGITAELANIVVLAAQRLGASTGLTGAEKYSYAESALLAMAKRSGIRLKPMEANAAIHAALASLDGVFAQEPLQAVAA